METRNDKTIPSEFIIELLDLVLKYNIFVFDGHLYQQLIGTAIGTRCAPNVADIFIFLSFIDEKIKTITLNFSENGINPLLIFRRFLDDILFIFLGSNDKLHKFLDEMNKIAPSIKFTMQHTEKCSDTNDSICDFEPCDSIPFLDTKLSIRDGKIKSDLYRKPSDREQYLLPSSCHPPHCTDNMQLKLKLKLSLAKS